MNSLTDTCHRSLLESFLQDDLNVVEERDLTLHLNECEKCRSELESRAGEPAAWDEISQLLKPQPFDDDEATWHGPQPSAQIQNIIESLAPTDDPNMLGRIGGYEVSGVVGAGAMGVVLKAHDKSLDRTVAIKVLSPMLASSGAARKRFAREAKAAAAVLHPNVMAIHSVSNDELLPHLVMPYVRGSSLQKRMDDNGFLAVGEALRIGSQIAAGLAAAHAQGLVHRDIKPANIMLEEGVERVAITDFGLARAVDDATMTRTGVIAGTPQYMSPEQARGELIDQQSDLFSLGALCTQCAPDALLSALKLAMGSCIEFPIRNRGRFVKSIPRFRNGCATLLPV
jgi:serine/threonine protein kinase